VYKRQDYNFIFIDGLISNPHGKYFYEHASKKLNTPNHHYIKGTGGPFVDPKKDFHRIVDHTISIIDSSPNQTIITGYSWGGFVALYTAAKIKFAKCQLAASINSPVNNYPVKPTPYTFMFIRYYLARMGFLNEFESNLKELSYDQRGRMITFHATKDSIVPPKAQVINKYNETQRVKLKHSGHFSLKQNTGRIIEFIKTH